MRNIEKECLYVGKAINLKNRVRSYFTDNSDNRFQIPYLISKVETLEWIATNSEVEALILEANLIKSYNPPYNIDLKDDKHYPYLKITIQERYPRLLIVRKIIKDGSLYFGPFTETRNMRQLKEFSIKLFKIRDCNMKLPQKSPVRPCINFSMGICSAPCAEKISEADYKKNTEQLIKFLKGERKGIINNLSKNMELASKELNFEEAAVLRDKIKLIKRISGYQKVDLSASLGSVDVFGIAELDRRSALSILSFREGLLLYKQHFIFKKTSWETSLDDRESAIIQFYTSSRSTLPDSLFLPKESNFSKELLESWFEKEKKHKIKISAPQKGVKRALVEMAEKNSRLHLIQKGDHNPEKDIKELKELLNLPRVPVRIEAFDISNLGEKFTVAAMVAFKNGVSDKKNYRNFKIKTVSGQDDFAMMMEAVTRRLDRLEREGKPFPDLLLIDGGKGQLSAASKPLKKYNNPPMIISLAKKEELLHSYYRDEPLRLPQAHPVRKLVERVRDEVHRRAISYHRKLRGKQFKGSSLENIPGIGAKKATALLKEFGSLAKLKMAKKSEIAKVSGFSEISAKILIRNINDTKRQHTTQNTTQRSKNLIITNIVIFIKLLILPLIFIK